MMRPKTLVITTNTTSNAIPLDMDADGYAIAAVISSQGATTGTATYTVQHTFADWGTINLNGTAKVTWFSNDDSALVNATTSQDGNYTQVPRATRIVTSNVSSAVVKYTVIAKGVAGG